MARRETKDSFISKLGAGEFADMLPKWYSELRSSSIITRTPNFVAEVRNLEKLNKPECKIREVLEFGSKIEENHSAENIKFQQPICYRDTAHLSLRPICNSSQHSLISIITIPPECRGIVNRAHMEKNRNYHGRIMPISLGDPLESEIYISMNENFILSSKKATKDEQNSVNEVIPIGISSLDRMLPAELACHCCTSLEASKLIVGYLESLDYAMLIDLSQRLECHYELLTSHTHGAYMLIELSKLSLSSSMSIGGYYRNHIAELAICPEAGDLICHLAKVNPFFRSAVSGFVIENLGGNTKCFRLAKACIESCSKYGNLSIFEKMVEKLESTGTDRIYLEVVPLLARHCPDCVLKRIGRITIASGVKALFKSQQLSISILEIMLRGCSATTNDIAKELRTSLNLVLEEPNIRYIVAEIFKKNQNRLIKSRIKKVILWVPKDQLRIISNRPNLLDSYLQLARLCIDSLGDFLDLQSHCSLIEDCHQLNRSLLDTSSVQMLLSGIELD